MSGLLALLDDVAAIAKLAATRLDVVSGHAVKAGAKAAGVVIDDAAVTPKYVTGLPAARELPIVWKIARASAFNKLIILTPAALALNTFLPWLITPLLMLGGCYLCFEGAEKVLHLFLPHHKSGPQEAEDLDAAHLEKTRVAGAIKTDFILSAEIMTIALSTIESDSIVTQALTLAAVAVGITALVYGAVALLVKMDDVGLKLSQDGKLAATRAFGSWLVRAMPGIMTTISTVGTAAMLWVGGSIIVHGLHDLGWHLPYETIKTMASGLGDGGFGPWLVTAGADGVLGLALGVILVPVVTKVIAPVVGMFTGKAAH